MPATNGPAWYPTAHSCATTDTNESLHPEIELQHVANYYNIYIIINRAINQQEPDSERNNNSWYAAAETNQLEPMDQRNQTRFPANWLRTPTVRLNLDLALPH